jgi:hypothetical protein
MRNLVATLLVLLLPDFGRLQPNRVLQYQAKGSLGTRHLKEASVAEIDR